MQPEIDINQALRERYELSQPLTFTRTMLWDLEQRKAAAPGIYIPFVVAPGSDRSWNRRTVAHGLEMLERCSHQRLWQSPDDYGLVLERARLDQDRQTVTFTGESTLNDEHGHELKATSEQPRFHVEHAAGGTEDAPRNFWRIVHLTDEPEPPLLEIFARIWESPW